MKSKKQPRSYRMTARAEAVAQTERDILRATYELWVDRSIHDITLEAVAERAEVSVRTILRKYGSKEGLFEACIEQDAGELLSDRDKAPAGDVEAALDILLKDYEKMGDANIRTLAVEADFEWARKLLQYGRTSHRRWCARVFAPYLPDPSDPAYESSLLAFYAATEVYLWKLLRRDMGKSQEETREVFRRLLEKLTH